MLPSVPWPWGKPGRRAAGQRRPLNRAAFGPRLEPARPGTSWKRTPASCKAAGVLDGLITRWYISNVVNNSSGGYSRGQRLPGSGPAVLETKRCPLRPLHSLRRKCGVFPLRRDPSLPSMQKASGKSRLRHWMRDLVQARRGVCRTCRCLPPARRRPYAKELGISSPKDLMQCQATWVPGRDDAASGPRQAAARLDAANLTQPQVCLQSTPFPPWTTNANRALNCRWESRKTEGRLPGAIPLRASAPLIPPWCRPCAA